MNKYISYFLRQGLVFILVICTCCMLSKYIDSKIDLLYEEQPARVNHASGWGVKERGEALISRSLYDKKNILIMGSSELNVPPPYKIQCLLPNCYYRGEVSTVGKGHVQNLNHAMNLGANYERVKDNNIVVMEGLQWFMGNEPGIKGFFANFSHQHFYDFLANAWISEDNKKYLCKRYLHMENLNEKKDFTNLKKAITKGSSTAAFFDSLIQTAREFRFVIVDGEIEFPTTYILARVYVSDNVFAKLLYHVLKPYFFFKGYIMGMKDKVDSLKWLYKVNTAKEDYIIFDDWDELYVACEKEGRDSCTNNGIYVDDGYFTKYLKERWEKLKDKDSKTELMISTEWEDFRFLLGVCRELGLEPYVVLQSTNGWYYDYVGMSKDKRNELYIKQEKIVQEYKFSYLNLKDKEYEPYFYRDVMHLGWKGWPYVTQNIVEHFSK